MKTSFAIFVGLAASMLLTIAPVAQAQTALISGGLGNFDVVNNTGQDVHGFEMDIDGIQVNDVVYEFSVNRYGAPTVSATPTGVRVRWASALSGSQFAATTIPHVAGQPFSGTCYQWSPATYDQAGCEHFGVSLIANPGNSTYRWLAADAVTAGTLAPVDPPLPVVFPGYYIVAPAIVGNPPALQAVVQAPEPAEVPGQYGDAQWMKVFKTQLNREVGLDELVTDNAVVPQDAAHVETAWDIVQTQPTSGGKRQRKQTQGGLDATTRSVVRRYEMYTYTGAYDPLTHEALCADLTCTAPSDGELGDFVSAQMTAANVVVPSVSVTRSGNGSVSTTDKQISCGSKCGTFYSVGATVTLTASASSGSGFAGWTGACSGTAANCTLNLGQHVDVGATFLPVYTLSIGRSNKGTIVTSDGSINCGGGGGCSGKFMQSTTLTLTATPPAGAQFLGWSGACSGTSLTCNVVILKDTQIQANFSK